MSVIIRLQLLPLSAAAADVRQFFSGLRIPEGAVNIVGGPDGDAFIGFASDEDARLAMRRDRGTIHDQEIRLLLSSRSEMNEIISQAKAGVFGRSAATTAPTTPVATHSTAQSASTVSAFNQRTPQQAAPPPVPFKQDVKKVPSWTEPNWDVSGYRSTPQQSQPQPSAISPVAAPSSYHVPVMQEPSAKPSTFAPDTSDFNKPLYTRDPVVPQSHPRNGPATAVVPSMQQRQPFPNGHDQQQYAPPHGQSPHYGQQQDEDRRRGPPQRSQHSGGGDAPVNFFGSTQPRRPLSRGEHSEQAGFAPRMPPRIEQQGHVNAYPRSSDDQSYQKPAAQSSVPSREDPFANLPPHLRPPFGRPPGKFPGPLPPQMPPVVHQKNDDSSVRNESWRSDAPAKGPPLLMPPNGQREPPMMPPGRPGLPPPPFMPPHTAGGPPTSTGRKPLIARPTDSPTVDQRAMDDQVPRRPNGPLIPPPQMPPRPGMRPPLAGPPPPMMPPRLPGGPLPPPMMPPPPMQRRPSMGPRYVELSRLPDDLLRPALLEQFIKPPRPLALSSVKVVYGPQGIHMHTLVRFDDGEEAESLLRRNGEMGIKIRPCREDDFERAIDGLPTVVAPIVSQRDSRDSRDQRDRDRDRRSDRRRSRSPAGGRSRRRDDDAPRRRRRTPSPPRRDTRRSRSRSPSVRRNNPPGCKRWCVQMRNVPFRASEEDIRQFITEQRVPQPQKLTRTYYEDGNASDRWIGEFETEEQLDEMLKVRGKFLQGRTQRYFYIDNETADQLLAIQDKYGEKKKEEYDTEMAIQSEVMAVLDSPNKPPNGGPPPPQPPPQMMMMEDGPPRGRGGVPFRGRGRGFGPPMPPPHMMQQHPFPPMPPPGAMMNGRGRGRGFPVGPPFLRGGPRGGGPPMFRGRGRGFGGPRFGQHGAENGHAAQAPDEPGDEQQTPVGDGSEDVALGLGPRGTVVMCRGFPSDITLEDVISFFQDAPVNEQSVRIRVGDNGQPTGECMLSIATPEAATRAVEQLDGRSLRGKTVAVAMA